MIKYVWLTATLMIVFCLISETNARSALTSTYSHVNSINSDEVQQNLHTKTQQNANDSYYSSLSSSLWKDVALVYKIYKQCANEQLSICLKVKLLAGLEGVVRSPKNLKIIEGIQFMKSNDATEAKDTHNKPTLDEKDIEAVLPRALDAKEHVLNNLIVKKIAGFFKDHTLQVKFPDVRSFDQLSGNSVEARKKKDKKGGGAFIMIPLLLGGTFVPIAYGALAMLAGKALIVSKLALVLASIVGIKKLLSGSGGKDSHEVVVSSGGHSGWGRDFDLAYSGWKPKETAKVN